MTSWWFKGRIKAGILCLLAHKFNQFAYLLPTLQYYDAVSAEHRGIENTFQCNQLIRPTYSSLLNDMVNYSCFWKLSVLLICENHEHKRVFIKKGIHCWGEPNLVVQFLKKNQPQAFNVKKSSLVFQNLNIIPHDIIDESRTDVISFGQ